MSWVVLRCYGLPCIVTRMDEDDATERLQQAMEDARLELGVKWEDIATRAGVSTSTLHRFRKGEGPRTAETTRRIEKAYGWPRGYIDALTEGRESPPDVPVEPESEPRWQVGTTEKLDELESTLLEALRELREIRDAG